MATSNQSRDHSSTKMWEDSFHGEGEQLTMAATSAKETAVQYCDHYLAEPARDLFGLVQDYVKSRPDVAAVWCFGLGLFLGWRLNR